MKESEKKKSLFTFWLMMIHAAVGVFLLITDEWSGFRFWVTATELIILSGIYYQHWKSNHQQI